MSSYRQAIRDSLCQIVLGLNPAPLPTTTIASADAGATAIVAASPADAANFRIGGSVTFWDGVGEPEAQVLSVVGSTINLTWPWLPTQGLQVDHHGTSPLVATNLLQVSGNPRDATLTGIMAGNGWPVIRVWSDDAVTSWQASHRTEIAAMVTMVVQLPAYQSSAAPNAQWQDLWRRAQVDRADGIVNAVIDAVSDNVHLVIGTAPGLSDFVPRFIESPKFNGLDSKNPLIEHYLTIQITNSTHR